MRRRLTGRFEVSVAGLLLLAAGCASSGVNMKEPMRLVGTENGVRIDAQITGDSIGTNTPIPVTWSLANSTSEPIAVAELDPVTSYDRATQTVVIELGSEVPGNELVPRLVAIAPGEKKDFSGAARVTVVMPLGAEHFAYPRYVRIKVNFLRQIDPFTKLIGIPERAIHDPQLADELFKSWVEHNDTITTNEVPIIWKGGPPSRNPIPQP
ncbi:MAG: hypothetical protein WBX15_09020 [Thermoanaerobaculia bacterium]